MKIALNCLALLAAALVGGLLAIVLYIHHYDHVTSPPGQHCWNEINAKMTVGVEEICIDGGWHE